MPNSKSVSNSAILAGRDLEITETLRPEDIAVLEHGLAEHATEIGAQSYHKIELGILRRNGAGKIIAGLTGYTVWNSLYIDTLWVAKAERGKGFARKLVHAAEAESIRRGCHLSYLWTQSWEAGVFMPNSATKNSLFKKTSQ